MRLKKGLFVAALEPAGGLVTVLSAACGLVTGGLVGTLSSATLICGMGGAG